jgi:hypothetical protein
MQRSAVEQWPRVEPPVALATFEVRWIRRGSLPLGLVEWFGRFSHIREERREDAYLRVPYLPGLSVKIRGGESLDVKQHRETVAGFELAGIASGQVAEWLKFSFALSEAVSPAATAQPSDWTQVDKHRRISVFSIATASADGGRRVDGACAAELTEIHVHGDAWWTLGFEANGRDALAGLQRTASMFLDEPLPVGELPAEEAVSYAEWLQRLPRHP